MKKIFLLTVSFYSLNLVSGQCGVAVPSSLIGSSALYDFNNDGIDDALISAGSSITSITGQNGTLIETNGSSNVKSYNYGVQLGVGTYASYAAFLAPAFPTNAAKFFGFKIPKNGNTYCGWAYIEYYGSQFYFRDLYINTVPYNYCVSTQPNVCIKTGESGGANSVEDEKFSEVTVKLINHQLVIDASNIGNFNVLVYNLLGNLVAESRNQASITTLDLDNIQKQVLVVTLSDTKNPSVRRSYKILSLD